MQTTTGSTYVAPPRAEPHRPPQLGEYYRPFLASTANANPSAGPSSPSSSRGTAARANHIVTPSEYAVLATQRGPGRATGTRAMMGGTDDEEDAMATARLPTKREAVASFVRGLDRTPVTIKGGGGFLLSSFKSMCARACAVRCLIYAAKSPRSTTVPDKAGGISSYSRGAAAAAGSTAMTNAELAAVLTTAPGRATMFRVSAAVDTNDDNDDGDVEGGDSILGSMQYGTCYDLAFNDGAQAALEAVQGEEAAIAEAEARAAAAVATERAARVAAAARQSSGTGGHSTAATLTASHAFLERVRLRALAQDQA